VSDTTAVKKQHENKKKKEASSENGCENGFPAVVPENKDDRVLTHRAIK
jgi:hypothetical protein